MTNIARAGCSMAEVPRLHLETRLPCPVCIGVIMHKPRIEGHHQVQLDHCRRCGGVWFDAGEVQQLRRFQPATFWSVIAAEQAVRRPQCHECGAFIDRGAAECAACAHRNVLDCPQCLQPLDIAHHDDVTLDVCRTCRGIWFDHAELSAIWRFELERAVKRRRDRGAIQTAGDGSLFLVDALMFDPFATYYGMQVAGHGAAALGEALAHAPGTLGAAAEVAGEAASSVFEVILDIIGGIFS
jgi:Zn-finger nucleic acid-binding protein